MKKNSNNKIKSEIISMTVVVVLAFSIRTFFMEIFFVPTGSMKGTILEGDYIFATKYDYGYSIYSIPFHPNLFEGRIFAKQPKRGDIIVMRPPHKMDERYVKRLIGLPGDKIEIIDNVTYINDIEVPRLEVGSYVSESGEEFFKYQETLPGNVQFFSYKLKNPKYEPYIDRDNYGPYKVEEGYYFFIGDNRDNSGDSRYQLGTVPFKNLIAKANSVLFSTKEFWWDSKAGFFEQIGRISTWVSSIRLNRFLVSLYPSEAQDD